MISTEPNRNFTTMLNVDTEKLAKQAKEIRDAQPKHDLRTADTLREELRNLEERKAQQVELIEEADAHLKEFSAQTAAKTDALKVAKDMVAVRPALRGDVRRLEQEIEHLKEETVRMEAYKTRHQGILDSCASQIKQWQKANGARLKELTEMEKKLSAAGL